MKFGQVEESFDSKMVFIGPRWGDLHFSKPSYVHVALNPYFLSKNIRN